MSDVNAAFEKAVSSIVAVSDAAKAEAAKIEEERQRQERMDLPKSEEIPPPLTGGNQ